MNNPEYVKVGDKKYKINTDFRVAIECQKVSMDETINNTERALTIIYLLFGEEGLKDKENSYELAQLAVKYLKCGIEDEIEPNSVRDMDFLQDYRLIQASFRSDYGITLSEEKMHWWDFYSYLNGLTDKCVLNRVREIRTYDTSKIKDLKEKNKIIKAQKAYALKEKIEPMTDKQKESVEKFYELTGIKRKV